MRITTLLPGLILTICFPNFATSDRAADSSALYAIKLANPGWVFDTINEVLWDNINGGQFTNMWRDGNAINHWEGVTVKNNRVVALNLRKSGLKNLPIAPGTLTELATLNLDNNQLQEISSDIGNLMKLASLSANNNELTTFPEDLGELPVKVIQLNSNKLTEVPEALFHFLQLETLDLGWNQLTELPEKIGNLTKLVTLHVYHNKLRAVPVSLKNCVKLERMSFAVNQLEDFPFEIFENMSRLVNLELYNNKLSKLTPAIGYLNRVEILRLNGNALTSIPPEISNLKFLRSLYLDSNMLTTFPPEFDSLSSRLTDLYVSHNQIDTLASRLFHNHEFDYLYLRGNKLRTIPLTLQVKKTLALDSNCIEYLPEDPIGNDWTKYCSTLEYLYLSGNNLKTLPKNVVNLTNLGRNHAAFHLNELAEKALDSSVIVWLNKVDSDWRMTQRSNVSVASQRCSSPTTRIHSRIAGSTILFADNSFNGLLVYLTDISGKLLASGHIMYGYGPTFRTTGGVVIVRIPEKNITERVMMMPIKSE